MKLTIGDWVMLVLFITGCGWAGSNDFDYRKSQADKELAAVQVVGLKQALGACRC